MIPEPLKPWAKTVVSIVIAVLAGGVAQGLINGAAAAWVTVIIGALASAGVYAAKNKM